MTGRGIQVFVRIFPPGIRFEELQSGIQHPILWEKMMEKMMKNLLRIHPQLERIGAEDHDILEHLDSRFSTLHSKAIAEDGRRNNKNG